MSSSAAIFLLELSLGGGGLNERRVFFFSFSLPFCRVNIKHFTILFVTLKCLYLVLVKGVYATGHHGV